MTILRASLLATLISATAMSEANAYETDLITQACLYTFSMQSNIPIKQLEIENVQSFSELSPPRVQFLAKLILDGNEPAHTKGIADLFGDTNQTHKDQGPVKCEFDSATKPMQLNSFMCHNYCEEFMWGGEKRLEELNILLQRAGY